MKHASPLRVRAKITSDFGGSAAGSDARRVGGSVSSVILDRPRNNADDPAAPRPGGLRGFGSRTSLLLGQRPLRVSSLVEPRQPAKSSAAKSEFIFARTLSQYRLAKDINVPARRINEIVKGQRAITADTALRLGRYFKMWPQFWLNLQDSALRICAVRAGTFYIMHQIERRVDGAAPIFNTSFAKARIWAAGEGLTPARSGITVLPNDHHHLQGKRR